VEKVIPEVVSKNAQGYRIVNASASAELQRFFHISFERYQ
jgi:hypothetical protein